MGQFTKQQRPKKQRKRRKNDMDLDPNAAAAATTTTPAPTPEQRKAYRKRIDTLTELADALLNEQGVTTIYQETGESLRRFL